MMGVDVTFHNIVLIEEGMIGKSGMDNSTAFIEGGKDAQKEIGEMSLLDD